MHIEHEHEHEHEPAAMSHMTLFNLICFSFIMHVFHRHISYVVHIQMLAIKCENAKKIPKTTTK